MNNDDKKKNAIFGMIFGVLISVPVMAILNKLSDEGAIEMENEYIASGTVTRYMNTRTVSINFAIENGPEIRIFLYNRDGERYNYYEVERLEHKKTCVNYIEQIYSTGYVKYSLKSINEGACSHE